MSFRSYETHPGTVGTLKPGKSGRGVSRPVYQYDYEEDNSEEEELDDYVDNVLLDDDLYVDIQNRIGSNYSGGTDSPSPRGSKQYHVGGNNVFEYAGNHRNYARQGISPYKQPKHSGPPLGGGGSGQAFRTTGNYRRTGTQYGSSRSHKLLTDIEDENLWDITKMSDPMERSFIRHNNRVKKVLNLIKEYLSNEIN